MTAQATQPEQRQGLFRKQAVEKQQDRLLGDVLVVPPLSYSLITALIVLFVAAAAVLLINGSYARKETVQGILVPDQGSLKVFASSAGIVRQVFVQEGDLVAKDQPLVLINGDRILANGEHLEEVLLAEYQIQQQLLTEQLQRIPKQYQLHQQELEQASASLKQNIGHLTAQINLSKQQIEVAESQLANTQALANKNLTSQINVDTAQEKLLGLKANQQSLLQQLDSQRAEQQQIKLQLAAVELNQANELEQTQRSLSNLAQSIAQLHGQRAYVIKASEAGTISGVQFKVGQEANSQQPLLSITPTGSELEADLLVPARAIGFVETGQAVKLRYSAFNYQKFGLYDATISEVSDAVLLPQEISGLALTVQEPMYRITAKLKQQHVDAYGKSLRLKAGISLEADIKLAERSLLEWLLEPLLSLKGRI